MDSNELPGPAPPRSLAGRRLLIAAGDSGAGLAGMRVQAFELGSRVAVAMRRRGAAVMVAVREDDEAFIAAVRAADAEVVALPRGRSALDRLQGFYRHLAGVVPSLDALYSLNPKIPFGALRHCRTALTIHDFCYLEFPQEFDRLRRAYHWINQRILLPRVDVVFTVSADAALRVRRHFPSVAPDRVVAAPNGFSSGLESRPMPGDLALLRDRFGLVPPYFVFLGKISPRKNLRLIIEAARRLAAAGRPPRVVLAGPKGWRDGPDFAAIAAAGLEACFPSTGFVEDAVLSVLLRRSAGLLYPSRCEGFGIPVLEGLAMGIPVVVARNTVCAEIGGAFVEAVDADDAAAMAAVMDRLARMSPVLFDGRAVAAHLRGFDWQVSAGIVADRLERLILSDAPATRRNARHPAGSAA